MSGALNRSSLSLSEMTWVSQKVAEIKQHAAWNEKIDEVGSERMLLNEAPFTFVFRPGKDMYHYFLSYVEADGTIHHKQIRIELSANGWIYRNGGSCIRERIEDLVPVAIHTAPELCRPYRVLRAPIFSMN
ncbi:MAG: hypothetical protein HYX48_01900 [Chlamydiales bacterium]|nr:hypothetical protein [Chlamydiales bacterium]